jgi:methyl-accepting chemotaxis protein
LSEVNSAVNQMDQVTQQNAAMVEETNAASATLAQETARLRELVDAFRLGGAADGGSSSRRPELVGADHRSVPSPAKQVLAKVRAKTAGGAAAVEWKEF